MSALLLDDLIVPVSTRTQPGRWRHVERRPQARPQFSVLPGGRPGGPAAPQVRRQEATPLPAGVTAAPGWQLTDRGIAVVVIFFLALVATAAVVLVTSFLSVSDAPLHVVPAGAAAVLQG